MELNSRKIRNVAIIAHVDHGKTTMIDKLMQQTGALGNSQNLGAQILDGNALEKERGITILAKNTAIIWQDYRINIVDTPGHADFGGEVERILSMVDSVLLLVDAVDGPMPQTRFVTQKAFAKGFNPIVVINKIDRAGARPEWVINKIFDLFADLGAHDEQLDFPIVYASALNGWATLYVNTPNADMQPLLQTIIDKVPPPNVDISGPFQMQISSLDYSNFQGAIGIGRIARGQIKRNTVVKVIAPDGAIKNGKVMQILRLIGLKRDEIAEAEAGDIVAITGIDGINISDTVCDPNAVEALPALTVDEPTMSMMFCTNDSPFAGKDGKFVTSRKLKERLEKELLHNVSLRVEPTADPDKFKVSGRGELHLSILIETMRREGYELSISRPEVVVREIDGVLQEPYEKLSINIPQEYQGDIMTELGTRGAALQDMAPDLKDRVQLEYVISTQNLIGFYTEFMALARGNGVIYHSFDHYGPYVKGAGQSRKQGVLISNAEGVATGFAIWNLQARGKLIIVPQTQVYEGMIIGLHTRDNDLVVNVCKEKQLTNMRASGKDENIVLVPPMQLSLEQALELIAEDEYVEVTPNFLRLRKKKLKEHERKKYKRDAE